jgi:hypothetical protein
MKTRFAHGLHWTLAQRQAQMNDAARKEYARRAYQMQEALRLKAQTDAKAREAYQALWSRDDGPIVHASLRHSFGRDCSSFTW